MTVYIHALREEGDPCTVFRFWHLVRFLSTPSARRATECLTDAQRQLIISIHALREEGDQSNNRLSSTALSISIHALREEGDHLYSFVRDCYSVFLSTPSARRATPEIQPRYQIPDNFYPRPPRGGRRIDSITNLDNVIISIHALREEGDSSSSPALQGSCSFLSTPSARRATGTENIDRTLAVNFYPRPPRGGRQDRQAGHDSDTKFLSTPSARRATPPVLCAGRHEQISIHALREEGDPAWERQKQPRYLFLSTPSARRATLLQTV